MTDRPFYGLANFAVGERVRVSDRETLEEFVRSWRLHHPLSAEQLGHAGQILRVASVSMYHGGDILYELEGIPGVWHQRLLEAVP
jgi:hypothetical protein